MKIRATYETETYLSQGGHFSIKQLDGIGDESIICLSPDQMRLLVTEMQKWLEDTSWWVDAIAEDDQV